jgi:REP element-mobilizing transposase RayT
MMHISFKVKYCHEIFRYKEVESLCRHIFLKTAKDLDIDIQELGFDRNHVHMIVDIGLKSLPEIAKYLKGRSGYKILKTFPWLKRRYFWGSGMWNPAIYFDSLGNNEKRLRDYVKHQGIQKKLDAY